MANKKRLTTTRQLARGSRVIRSFVEAGPVRRDKVDAPRPISVGLHIGRILAVEYQATNGISYRHKFKAASAPKLIVSADGKQLAFIGGKYQFTGRGIQDR